MPHLYLFLCKKKEKALRFGICHSLPYKNGGSPRVGNGLLVAIVSALRYWGMGLPNNVRAAMAIKGQTCWGVDQWCKLFDVTMITLSSSLDDLLLIGVGSKAGSQAETKCLHLFANP
jgi:hypothetical protein